MLSAPYWRTHAIASLNNKGFSSPIFHMGYTKIPQFQKSTVETWRYFSLNSTDFAILLNFVVPPSGQL
jgi:hypothetical protein